MENESELFVSAHSCVFVTQAYADSNSWSAAGVLVKLDGTRKAVSEVVSVMNDNSSALNSGKFELSSVCRYDISTVLKHTEFNDGAGFCAGIAAVILLGAAVALVLFLVSDDKKESRGGESYLAYFVQTGILALSAFVVSVGGTFGVAKVAGMYANYYRNNSLDVFKVTGVEFAVLLGIAVFVAALCALVPWLVASKKAVDEPSDGCQPE